MGMADMEGMENEYILGVHDVKFLKFQYNIMLEKITFKTPVVI